MNDFNELRNTGLLWLINRQVFHPRGYALAFVMDKEGNAVGWELIGDGIEPFNYQDGTESDYLALTNVILAPQPSEKGPE